VDLQAADDVGDGAEALLDLKGATAPAVTKVSAARPALRGAAGLVLSGVYGPVRQVKSPRSKWGRTSGTWRTRWGTGMEWGRSVQLGPSVVAGLARARQFFPARPSRSTVWDPRVCHRAESLAFAIRSRQLLVRAIQAGLLVAS
jgi:hypothetical protein